MFESLYVGMSGLQGYAKGLRVISNNVTNLNTPGFKGAKQQFGDLFYQNGTTSGSYSGSFYSQYGTGLNTLGTSLNFQPGEIRQTGNGLEVALDGEGFFVVDVEGEQRYTRAGQFAFDADGYLVLQSTSHRVQGFAESGVAAPVSINGLRVNRAKATTEVEISGNLSSTSTEAALEGVKILDGSGEEHVMRLVFRRQSDDGSAGSAGRWTVDVIDGTTTVHTATVQFTDGRPTEASRSFSFSFTPADAAQQSVTVRLGTDMTSFASGSTSSLVVSKQDGYAAGNLAQLTFSEQGILQLSYSNGQKVEGARLAVAMFDDMQGLEQLGGGLFSSRVDGAARVGRAGEEGRGKVNGGQLELSNVDLSAEFSELIVMQRGYQAASRIVSTANEMLQELFDMKGRR